ncbi:spermidine/putrescine transport system substrate-binding protein [Pseudobutyrivibrio sp. YE44]|uniref:ABC transporter substrate-binding protein n=1 Tax=Pseudobutyrivibrio sp. YE44 TaxID=1520802 RepID=UPI0008848021|nr:ABC transporter substrate-binding protein [Pseudobutyrivibrio sp. YE44]SDB12394.1 spermidine/putrescine transport system substrate-binding protein [Pseudobutyrivibrio sp. YE44]
MKNKLLSFLSILILTAAPILSFTGCGSDAEATDTLVVLNYGKYIESDVLKRFQKETGITVKYEEYEQVEDMYAKYKAGSINYDVICTSDYMIETLRNEGELIPIDYSSLPNYKNIDKQIIDASAAFDPTHEYTVPYFYGTVGILYNTEMVDEETVSSWDSLWNPEYKNKIVMINSQRDAMMVALEKLGYDINTTDKKQLDEAYDLLCAEKKYVYAYLQDETYECMISEDAAMAVCYSGEAAMGMEYNENLSYTVPKEGGNLWIDSWFVPRTCKHYDAAMKWIDFMCEEEAATENFEYVWYATPNTKVAAHEDEETLADETVFPTKETLDRCKLYEAYDDETLNYTTNLWKKLKAY